MAGGGTPEFPGIAIIPWYATVLRQESFVAEVAKIAPIALRYGATRYAVHRSRDDRYRINQMSWFDTERDWYRFWESPEMQSFRARLSGQYQIPVVYYWSDEVAAGELGPQVPDVPAAQPVPELDPTAAA